MKKLFLGLFLFLTLGNQSQAAYSPSDTDFVILDRIEQKVFDLVESDKIEPEDFISKVQQLLDDKEYSERVEGLLSLLIEDLSYSYELSGDSEEFGMSEDDCYEDEIYDAESGVCIPDYYDNGGWDDYYDDYGYDDEEYSDDSGYYEDEEYYDDSGYYDDGEGSDSYPDWYGGNEDFGDEYIDDTYEDGEEDWKNVDDEAVYKISGNTLTLSSGKKDEKHHQIWSLFTAIIPESYRTDLNLYSVYDDSQSDIMASVYQNEQDNTTWDISVNKAFMFGKDGTLDTKESIHTLVHEFTHILTLGKGQVDYIPTNITSDSALSRLKSKCPTTFIAEGCLKKDAYLEAFKEKFWSQKDFEATEYGELDLYSKNKNAFVSDYAASNVGEDIAETFTYFVLEGKPSGKTIAEQKILFFYDYEELVALRELMRKRIAEINTSLEK